ncbi:MAG: UDP-N-acetylmuramate dehydrogenase [Nitrospirae bacterium]|nr:MAG: UDP-N-acetylmuramate dehydrogenase [Nitrospirota bacterium]
MIGGVLMREGARHRPGRKSTAESPAGRTSSAQGTHDFKTAVAGLRGEVRFKAPLKDFTSFRIGGPADVLVIPADLEDLCRLMRQVHEAKVPLFVIGGTNLLVRDKGIRGVVVNLSKLNAVHDEPDHVVYAEGGVGMPTLMKYAISRSLGGLEWAAGIPGTVAGCVVMNAGTRLGEMKDALKAVRLVDPRGQVIDCPASAIRFTYRRALLPRGIVAGAWLQLRPGPREQIEGVVKEYLRHRRDTQPLALPSAGCVFKNPPQDAAGRLIEAAGLKGARVGDAQVSEKHANFVVNLGQARAADVIALIKKVGRAVEEQTGVTLELELKIVGQP